MPHLVLEGTVDFAHVAAELGPEVVRWGRAVLKTGDAWRRSDDGAILVEGVVIELQRPLHPVALVATREEQTVIRLWSVVEVERTPAVQHWLAILACSLQRLGCGAVTTTNIGPEVLDGLDLEIDLD